jgi:hypothetical protein
MAQRLHAIARVAVVLPGQALHIFTFVSRSLAACRLRAEIRAAQPVSDCHVPSPTVEQARGRRCVHKSTVHEEFWRHRVAACASGPYAFWVLRDPDHGQAATRIESMCGPEPVSAVLRPAAPPSSRGCPLRLRLLTFDLSRFGKWI